MEKHYNKVLPDITDELIVTARNANEDRNIGISNSLKPTIETRQWKGNQLKVMPNEVPKHNYRRWFEEIKK